MSRRVVGRRHQKRAAIMVACEGKTEANLWRWLKETMRDAPIAIHFPPKGRRSGGDAYSVLDYAVKQYERAKKTKDLDRLVVMLDTDKGWDIPINRKDAQGFARNKRIITILSRPRCEHLLMGLKGQANRLDGCHDDAEVEKRLVTETYRAEPPHISWKTQGITLRDVLSRDEFRPLVEAFPSLQDYVQGR